MAARMQQIRITIAGFAGRAAESTGSVGGLIAQFPLCYSESAEGGGTRPTWVRVSASGPWLAAAQRVRKGDNVYVEGKFTVTSGRDRTGAERLYLDVIAHRLAILQPDGDGRSYGPPEKEPL